MPPTGADGGTGGEQKGFPEPSTERVSAIGSPLPFPKLPLWAPLSAKSRCRPSSTEWQGGCGKAPSIISMWVISWLWDTCSRSRGLLVPTLPQASFAPGPQAGVWVRQKLQPDVEGLSQHQDQPLDLLRYPALDSISKSFCSYSPLFSSQEPQG